MLEVFDFTVVYATADGILHPCIIMAIASTEGLIIFVLDISNAFHNTFLPDPAERIYLSFPYLYLDWCKIRFPKHPLASRNQKELFIHEIK